MMKIDIIKGKEIGKYNNEYSILESYEKNLISKVEALIRINLMSNRSFRDINQYPIFPWIINNNKTYIYNNKPEYIKINELLDISNLRPLDKPMGTLTENRFTSYEKIYKISNDEFIENYGEMKIDFSKECCLELNKLKIEMEEIPIYYGSHYSNPIHVCHYLIRLFPYTIITQLIHDNRFDISDRLFINFDKSYFSASNIKTDLRELIPEIYFQPELFRNINHLNLGNLQVVKKEDSTYQILKNIYNTNEIRVEDVLLPNWSDNNPEKFICLMREIFERPEIKINNWIDLIFGYAQRGEEAL